MKKYILIVSVLSLALGACKKTYLNQEINPNAPSTTTPQFTLSAAENTAAAITANDYTEYGVWAGYWTNSGNYTPSTELAQFSFSTTDFPGPDCWDDLYSNLANINLLQTSTQGTPALSNFTAIALILKAYDFQQLVDNFNNVPYTQAFQPSKILFPEYDNGQDIYNDLVKQLDAAISLIQKSAGATNPGSSDIVYGGVMSNWAKFANTIKLRLAIRQSNLSTNAAQTDLASTAAVGYIDNKSEADAQPGYSNTAGKENPFYGNFGFDATGNTTFPYLFYRANQVDTDIMHQLNDPRGHYYYGLVPPAAGSPLLVVRGNQLGNKNNASNSNTSPIGPGLLKSPSQPSPIFSSYESYFLQAEAALRGWIPGDPATLYAAGIAASFNAVGCPGAAAYATQAQVAYPTSVPDGSPVGTTLFQLQLQAIITQKYISLNGLFNNEAYTEFKRTGYPALPQNPASADPNALSGTLPTRLPYPSSELTNNGAVLAKQGTINPLTDKVFWDK
jgi:hypothetical protein